MKTVLLVGFLLASSFLVVGAASACPLLDCGGGGPGLDCLTVPPHLADCEPTCWYYPDTGEIECTWS